MLVKVTDMFGVMSYLAGHLGRNHDVSEDGPQRIGRLFFDVVVDRGRDARAVKSLERVSAHVDRWEEVVKSKE
jgi:hypothetical protein